MLISTEIASIANVVPFVTDKERPMLYNNGKQQNRGGMTDECIHTKNRRDGGGHRAVRGAGPGGAGPGV